MSTAGRCHPQSYHTRLCGSFSTIAVRHARTSQQHVSVGRSVGAGAVEGSVRSREGGGCGASTTETDRCSQQSSTQPHEITPRTLRRRADPANIQHSPLHTLHSLHRHTVRQSHLTADTTHRRRAHTADRPTHVQAEGGARRCGGSATRERSGEAVEVELSTVRTARRISVRTSQPRQQRRGQGAEEGDSEQWWWW